jgi:hypothetical protein
MRAMKAGLPYLLAPLLIVALLAGCAPKGHYWPSVVIKSAQEAKVKRDGNTITIVTRTEGNDGMPVSPTELDYNAALLRAARESKADGFSRFEVIKTGTDVISDIIDHVGANQRVRITMMAHPLPPDEAGDTHKTHDAAEVLAGPVGGYI